MEELWDIGGRFALKNTRSAIKSPQGSCKEMNLRGGCGVYLKDKSHANLL